MKKSRKYVVISVILAIFNLFSALSVSCYSQDSDVVVSLTMNNTMMQVNGQSVKIDEGSDTAPAIINNRILVPIRAIIEAFGGTAGWEGASQTVVLNMNNKTMRLGIGNNVAYVNGMPKNMDTAPAVINERTMLPVRFVAEGFNLGVAWEQDKQRVTIIRNTFDDMEYQRLMSMVPAYSGSPYAIINGNRPFFETYEIIGGSFEYYSELDYLGRCDVCMASVGEDIMPTEDRESISSVTPTGWKNASYDFIDGNYVYNRCHLIGFQLTGENANEKNLITGTRYMNVDGMLPFENMINDYVEASGNNVVYRVTPVFYGNNLVADGVLLEAYSVEDNGRGICFCVYCYNVQPGVNIDYATGYNYSETYTWQEETPEVVVEPDVVIYGIYRTPTGKRYHYDPDCGGKNSYETTLDDAINAGMTPCQKCAI